jgi:hypothetical protein
VNVASKLHRTRFYPSCGIQVDVPLPLGIRDGSGEAGELTASWLVNR